MADVEHSQSRGTTEFYQLSSSQHTTAFLSTGVRPPASTLSISFGRQPFKIVYLFVTSPITRTTRIRTFASLRVDSTSTLHSCSLHFVKRGICSIGQHSPKLLTIRNPISACTPSPYSSRRGMPLGSLMHLSLARPPYAFERN